MMNMMEYTSTRSSKAVTSAQAILQGIAEDGGLFVPSSIPALTGQELESLLEMDYVGRACLVLSKYLTDFSKEQIEACVKGAYLNRFDGNQPAPLREAGGMELLELWHGPTCAFKDLALQLLPYLMTTSAQIAGDQDEIVILVATSGDTGKAALEGFKNVKGTKILVFYPQNGVSPMQKRQMTTQEGDNVGVCAIDGNFDDAQTGVKAIFGSREVAAQLRERGMAFSSANSINWGRLVPQIVYYVSAYCDMAKAGKIKMGDPINVVVPTGNFGNILAGYFAMRMGIPVNRFLCASNRNRVLTDFINTGVYDRNREFYTTASPSMDILISSNLERLLYLLSGEDTGRLNHWMEELKTAGRYEVDAETFEKLTAKFSGEACDDGEGAAALRQLFEKTGYLCDTHTAVAVGAYQKYLVKTGDDTPAVIVSTASPYKFAASVLEALGQTPAADDFAKIEQLAAVSGTAVPAPIAALKGKSVRFTKVCDKASMVEAVYSLLRM